MIDLKEIKPDDLVAQQEALDEHLKETSKPRLGFENLFYKGEKVVSNNKEKKKEKGIVGAVKKIFTRKNSKNRK